MNNINHTDLAMKLSRLEAILEPIPERLNNIEKNVDERLDKIQEEITELKQARSHLVGIGVGVGITFTFIAGLIAAAANGALKWLGLTQ